MQHIIISSIETRYWAQILKTITSVEIQKIQIMLLLLTNMDAWNEQNK